ncbi:MAG TPA: hypothetical protein VGR55_14240 [Candidatus Acidoferrum sp.]|nr:hypothetical protein [Candidatus Acidoferrum sp.]
MKHITLTLFALSVIVAPSAVSQTTEGTSSTSHSAQASPSSYLFPRNWIRGYTDFAVAPPHNEPDLGRCMFPQPASAGGTASQCTAYARYLFSGYLEIQPLARTPLRHLFFFFEPRFSFGRNIPQLSYQASMEPMAYDRALGAAFELPRNLQLRVTQHQVDYLGRYGGSLGSADLHTTGPYGLYTTVSVRWTFGGYGRNGAPSAY